MKMCIVCNGKWSETNPDGYHESIPESLVNLYDLSV